MGIHAQQTILYCNVVTQTGLQVGTLSLQHLSLRESNSSLPGSGHLPLCHVLPNKNNSSPSNGKCIKQNETSSHCGQTTQIK